MPIIYHVAPDGTRIKLAEGVPGGRGDPGPQVDSAFDVWNAANGGTKTQADFLAYIGPDYVPSQASVAASGPTTPGPRPATAADTRPTTRARPPMTSSRDNQPGGGGLLMAAGAGLLMIACCVLPLLWAVSRILDGFLGVFLRSSGCCCAVVGECLEWGSVAQG